ncbi:hypothetical protein BEWA_022320 [Theileria equi strain WA]|uniref:Uncharacterized protein n=1 Tax=Theileria equi strain WA TaxID=1537102 RepID=L0AWX9_THEEQ|nr:hypothetical protein BEWA_022320 [Theileria equi strain WA]AFZ79384.1 hypothetical protein BEWA_022320 [Theileria equi strain WA]|eukprot:XP_004829050.1 hypothetical protein BEWA_022320 [Theileria equi strain WA]
MNSARSTEDVDNEDLFAGLALQRQWDDKPDLDQLYTTLMEVYCKLENNEDVSEQQERLYLLGTRVKAKTGSFMNSWRYKMKHMATNVRVLKMKKKTVAWNIPRIEQNYLAKCKFYQKKKSFNEVYDKLGRIVSRLPNVKQLDSTASELLNRRIKIMTKIDKLKEQIEAQKSQIDSIYLLLSKE